MNSPQQGVAAALSADGNTAIVGGFNDNNAIGAAWIFTRSSAGWAQQGAKLVPGDSQRQFFGSAVALSADGITALIGGPLDGNSGVAWVFVRTGNTWTQQGPQLTGSGVTGLTPALGAAVALSADGNTALVGCPGDNAVWVFSRSGTTWTQQGDKLTGSSSSISSQLGTAVALSADGNTALVGGANDNGGVGAAWMFTRTGTTWTQVGGKMVGTGAVGASGQGISVALSGDGTTASVGGFHDNNWTGAVWIFALGGGIWSQQGDKLVGSGGSAQANQGRSVALSADGNVAMFGAPYDNPLGAAWIFTRSGTMWTQQGGKLVGSGSSGTLVNQGDSVALAADGGTALMGGHFDFPNGAAWVFAKPVLLVSAPVSAGAAMPFDVAVVATDSAGSTVTGYQGPVHFSSTDEAAALPGISTLTNGSGTFPVTLFTPGNQTISVTDSSYKNISGVSGAVYVPSPPTLSMAFGEPTTPLRRSVNLSFTITNPNVTATLTGVAFTDVLPAGLAVATPSGLTGGCSGGEITASNGSIAIGLSGASIPPGASCSFALHVTGSTAGTKNNVTSVVRSDESGAGAGASAALVVVAPPVLAETLSAPSIPANGLTSLTYSITNPALNVVALTGVAFTDMFPAHMVVASPARLANTCGGAVSAAAGSGTVTLSGVTIEPGSACSLTVNITVTAASTYNTNPTTVVSTNGGAGNTVSIPLTVLIPVTLTSIPAGLVVALDGVAYASGQTIQLPLNSAHTISTVTPQAGAAGTSYLFQNWSDAGSVSHTILVPATPIVYTASFATQYQLTISIAPAAGGTVAPVSGGFYDAGSSVALTASPGAGYFFSGWTGPANPSRSAAATVVMNAPVNLTANFTTGPLASAILNSASFQPAAAAPNTILSIFGGGFNCSGGPQVVTNGVQASVLYSSDTQINFVVPMGAGTTGSADLQIVCNGATAEAGTLALAPADPAIFTLTENGSGPGAVLNLDYSVNGTQSPAGLGDYIFVYGTGFGNLGPAGPDGLRRLILPVTASIGGAAAQVVYAGEAPGFTPGLQQINVQIPANAPSGPAVLLQLIVDEVSTQSGVTIAIR